MKRKERDKYIKILQNINVEEKNLAMFILKYYPELYCYINDSLKNDIDIINLVISDYPLNLLLIDKELISMDINRYFDLLKNIDFYDTKFNVKFNDFFKYTPKEIYFNIDFQYKYLMYIYETYNETDYIFNIINSLRLIKFHFHINKDSEVYKKYKLIETYFMLKESLFQRQSVCDMEELLIIKNDIKNV